eukprot:CAMPEP_0117431318 /NCGR_PEP_ID=MMETSP0758-20121206/10853_1 /TAXON_ID=63605 /ORGANISM="Percolomonas cosmopolitus, Strain AE-1 (ATCC 50343)" /LENGTH=381 /DNA_ID=CAMNT_0005220209 /DNA_START=331 /DNA_END=1477 /DNA_ORIENTATION=+
MRSLIIHPKKIPSTTKKRLPVVIKPIVEEDEKEITEFKETHDYDAIYSRIIETLILEDIKKVFNKGFSNLEKMRGKIERGVYRGKDAEHAKFQHDLYAIFERCFSSTHHNSLMNKQGKRLLVLAKQLVYDAFFPSRKPPSFFDVFGKKPSSNDDLMLSKVPGVMVNNQFQYHSNDVYNFPSITQEQLIKLCFAILARLRSEDAHGIFDQPVPKENVDYHAKIADPLDFSLISQRIRRHRYTTFHSFFLDLDVCFANARYYNAKTTTFYKEGARLALLLRRLVSDVDSIMTAMGSLPPHQWDLPAMVGPSPKTEALHMRRIKYAPPFLKEKLMRLSVEIIAHDRHLPWSPIKDAVNRGSFSSYDDFVSACLSVIDILFLMMS